MEEKNLAKQIREKIKKNHLKIKPKSYFLLKNFLVVLSFILLLLVALFSVSFVLFVSGRGHFLKLLSFKILSLKEIMLILPWALIGGILLLWFVLEVLAKRFKFVYRYPLIISLGAFVFITTTFGFAVLPVQKKIFNIAQKNKLPFFGKMYLYYASQYGYDVYLGKVISKNGDSFTLKTDSGRVLVISVDNQTKICGDISSGKEITVMVSPLANGQLLAKRIKASDAFNCHFGKKAKKMK